jgi:transcriptional regulator with XRE-family HTH domain
MNRIKQLRESHGYTHEQLAEHLEIGYASVYRYESGKKVPPGEVLEKMADLFHVSVDYLLGRTSQIDATLTDSENKVIHALRQGNRLKAIQMIIEGNNEEKAQV